MLVRRDTRLVVDGYPSSGNSFSVNALRAAGAGDIRMAHHLHCPGQVRWAVAHDIPVLLLIRDPRDAAVSVAARWPLTLQQALRFYATYYEAVEPLVDAVCVADFDEVVTDMGAVTRRLNDRYDTTFPVFDHNPASVSVLFDPHDETHLQRRTVAAELRVRLGEPSLAPALDRAMAARDRITERRWGTRAGANESSR